MEYENIPSSAWKPNHEEFEYPEEMVRWINSINKGWQYRVEYEPFVKYCQQAHEWLQDKSQITDYDDPEDQTHWLLEEIDRIKENTLYFCNKYGKIKEDRAKDGSGMINYMAWEPQKVLLFLFDCGYSFMVGKARQVGFTTTLCLAGMKRVNFNPSYFVKFITHSENKGKEIFKDKVKWAFSKIPYYMAEEVKNWTDLIMGFERNDGKKGRENGSGSRFQVDSPKEDAINGGSPSLVMVDEIGLFEIFGEMMREGRPALFKYDPIKKKMTQQQQFIAWGTGGEMDKGGAVFEAEFRECLKQWNEGKYDYGIIPLFFNAYARPGVDEDYLKKEIRAYSQSNLSKKAEKAMVQFYQAYPIVVEHMFLRKAKTLVPIELCAQRKTEIWSRKNPVEYGYFEPIYDMNQPTPDLFFKHRVIGAKFVQTDGEDHAYTTVCISKHPAKGKWKYRYYQGTDPINSETGHSKMSSTILDWHEKETAATMFFRDKNLNICYAQCVLLGLYYDQLNEGGVPELVENNIGDTYVYFKESHKFKRSIVANARLHDWFRKPSGKWFGISNKVDTAPRIIAKLEELIDGYHQRLDIPWLWMQLEKFVEKDLNGSNSHRQTRYQAADLRYDFDDVIFSHVIAYINADAHAKYVPTDMSNFSKENRVYTKYVQNAATNWRPVLCQVDQDGNILKRLNMRV